MNSSVKKMTPRILAVCIEKLKNMIGEDTEFDTLTYDYYTGNITCHLSSKPTYIQCEFVTVNGEQ